MAFGNYWEKWVMDHLFNILSRTTNVCYVGLSSADPAEDGSGTSEPPAGKTYARIKVMNGSGTSFQIEDASGTTINNSVAIEFDTATVDWGTLTHAFIASGNTSGSSICAYGALDSSVVPTVGQAPKFNANALKIGIR